MKTEKLFIYVVVAFIAYALFTRYSATVAAAKAQAAGNSTAGIIGASIGGATAILSELPIYGGAYDDSDDY